MIPIRPRTVFLVAVVLGLIGGLAYAWFASPVEVTNVSPAELRAEFRTEYVQLVGASYGVENDWPRAQFRLKALGEADSAVARQVAQETERLIAEGRSAPMLRAMSRFADKLGARTAVMVVYLATEVPTFAPAPTPTRLPPTLTPLPSPSATPTFARPDTPTPLPTLTPTSTPKPGHLLVEQERVCEPGAAQIRVVVEDEKGKGIPGVQVWVTWEGGADRSVTGLQPAKGAGYADVDIQPGVLYAVAIAQSALSIVRDLKTEPCPASESGQPVWASWKLLFRPVPPTPTPTPTPTEPATSTPTPGPALTLTTTLTTTTGMTTTTTTTTPTMTRRP